MGEGVLEHEEKEPRARNMSQGVEEWVWQTRDSVEAGFGCERDVSLALPLPEALTSAAGPQQQPDVCIITH